MEEATGETATDTIKALNDAFMEDPFAEIDAVSGATELVEDFKKSAEILLTAAEAGDTEEQTVDLKKENSEDESEEASESKNESEDDSESSEE